MSEKGKQALLEEALEILSEALKNKRADGVKFAVLDTRAAFIELRTKMEGAHWSSKLNGAIRKTSIKHRVHGFILAEVARDGAGEHRLVITWNPDYTRYNPARTEHRLHEFRDHIIDPEPYAVFCHEDAKTVTEVLALVAKPPKVDHG